MFHIDYKRSVCYYAIIQQYLLYILRWSLGRRLGRNFCSATSLYFIELQKKWRLTVVCCVSVIFVFIMQESLLTVELHKQIKYLS